MGYEEIIKCLKRNKNKWLTASEIYQKIKSPNIQNIHKHLNKLYKYREILIKEKRIGNNWNKLYKYRD